MSRNSKNAKKQKLAKDITAMHLAGKRGPKKTQKKHTKVNCWYKDRYGTKARKAAAVKEPANGTE